jgi:multidrug efflux system membrane fusion protein
VLTIPSVAIQRGPNGIFTWVITPKNTAEARRITSGAVSGNQTIVTSGLAEGEHVVIDGQYKLRQNSAVAINAPAPALASQDRTP